MSDSATLEWVCGAHEERVARVFAELALERPELASVRDLWQRGEAVGACEALLDHFRGRARASGQAAQAPPPSGETDPEADAILADTFTFQNVTGMAPRLPDGTLDWTCRGPNDDAEWAFMLNRHDHLNLLVDAYLRTGHRAYGRRVDADLREWVLANPYPGAHTDDPRWRGLEVMSRISVWPQVLARLADDPVLQPGTRLLVLSCLPDHAHYTRYFHDRAGNWLAMQMNALIRMALLWPESAAADEWVDYATATLTPELHEQVYPDGVQKELASHYHGVSRYCFESFAQLLAEAGREVPEVWRTTIERMWEYTAYSLRPDGHGVLNNDSNLDLNGPAVLRAAETWGRPDWAFIASNGEQGLEPEAGPSAVFPWAGQFIMRSGWEREAHWGVFDVGPWGTGHQHNDKLHLSISAGGRDLLVDAGRLYYKHDSWRRFVMSSAAHNTVLVDGRGQRDDVPQVDAPLDEAAYHIGAPVDYARGAFAAGYEGVAGTAVHTRAVAYVRGRFWVVVDRVETDRPRQVQALWHFHPHCAVEQRGAAVHTANAGKHNVCVVPTGDPVWRVDRVAGQEEPHIQGWYSREYNVKEAATCAVYTADVPGTTSWAWVIAPGPGAVTEPSAEWLGMAEGEARVRVRHRDETLTVHVPLDAGQVRVN